MQGSKTQPWYPLQVAANEADAPQWIFPEENFYGFFVSPNG